MYEVPIDVHHDFEDILDELGRQSQAWLVEHDELRRGHQRPADGQHLLFAARKRAGLLAVALLEQRQELVDLAHLGHHGPLVLDRERTEFEVLADCHIRKEQPPFRHLHDPMADNPIGVEPADALAAKSD